jgi:hypothetical protein
MMAEGIHPFPYRTRKLSPPAPMVLGLKPWESRSLPGHQPPLQNEVGVLLCFGKLFHHTALPVAKGQSRSETSSLLLGTNGESGFMHMGEVSPEYSI